jgi:hypothetical protein
MDDTRQKATGSTTAPWNRARRRAVKTRKGVTMKNVVEQTRYGLRVEIPVNYERAVEHATAALKAEGFGVLTTIDVQHTLKQKLDRDFR